MGRWHEGAYAAGVAAEHKALAEALRRACRARGMANGGDLARALGCHPSTTGNWWDGRTGVSGKYRGALRELLGDWEKDE